MSLLMALALVAQILDPELVSELEYRFIPIFGATRYRIGEGWKERGGYAGKLVLVSSA